MTNRCEENAAWKNGTGFSGNWFGRRAEHGDDYIGVIRALNGDASSLGTEWLRQVVDDVGKRALACVPSCRMTS